MKRLVLLLFVIILGQFIMAQTVYNPNVAIKPLTSFSVYKVEMKENSTAITFRIVNDGQLPPFSLKSEDIILRRVSDTLELPLIKAENVKFYPEQHSFTYDKEILEFTLYFGGLPQPAKYVDVIEKSANKDFYVQGIILDEDMNTEITRGFNAYKQGDIEGALNHFINFNEMDLYFEYGFSYFFVLNILSNQNRWKEAGEWYQKFKDKFFYDKQLHINALQKMGIIQRLEEGK